MKILFKISVSVICTSFLISPLFAADSAGNRADSSILIGYQTGAHLASMIAPPLRIGTFVGDWEIALDMGSNSWTNTSGSASGVATYKNQGLNTRYFVGNSSSQFRANTQQRIFSSNACLVKSVPQH